VLLAGPSSVENVASLRHEGSASPPARCLVCGLVVLLSLACNALLHALRGRCTDQTAGPKARKAAAAAGA
jgi:hypothetical protein